MQPKRWLGLAALNPGAAATVWSQYRNMSVVRFNLTSADDLATLETAATGLSRDLDVWAHGRGYVDVTISGMDLDHFLDRLPLSLASTHTMLIDDVAQLVRSTYPSQYQGRLADEPHQHSEIEARWIGASGDDAIFFSDYQPLDVRHSTPRVESGPWLTCGTK
jgi:hypothetical protein